MIKFIFFLFRDGKERFSQFRLRTRLENTFDALSLANTCKIIGPVQNLMLGENVQIGEYVILHLGGYKWSHNKGFLSIGKNAVISPHCVIYAAGPEGIEIGHYFDCAPGVKIFASRSYFEEETTKHEFGKVNIGNNVILYSNVVIGPKVTIGDNVIVAANSVVTTDLESNALYGGCPAKKIRTLP